MSVRRLSILAAAVAMLAAVAGPAGGTAPENEPNNLRTESDVITGYPCYEQATGSIAPIGDLDYTVINTPKHSQVWALVDTGGTQTNSENSFLRLETLGGTLIEEDNDDGTSTGGDDSEDNEEGSLLAGVEIVNGGTGFLQVSEVLNDDLIDSYRLYAAVTKGHVAEIEPNGDPSQADLVTRCPHVRSGAISPASEVDWFQVVVGSPTTLFLALDGDPGRTSPSDLVLELYDTDGTTLLIDADASAAVPAVAEGFIFDVLTPGSYFVKVRGFGVATGDYRLLFSGLPTVMCRGRVATMTGSPNADIIEGTDGSDRTSGFDGRDTIFGRGGKDRLCGGKKRDVIRGGRKKDRISGGRGGDLLRGGRGPDRIKGNKGNDQMFGGRGDDICIGGAGSDSTNSC